MNIDPLTSILVVQTVFAFISMYFLYKTVTILFNHSIGIKSSILFSLTPLFWITNSSIMMETTYVAFFIFFLYFFVLFSKSKLTIYRHLIFGNIFFSLSFLTHMIIILWIPFSLYLFYLLNKKRIMYCAISLFISLIIVTMLNGYLLSQKDIIQGIILLYTGKLQERGNLTFDILSVSSLLRNIVIPSLRNYTTLLCIFAFLGLFKIAKQKRKFILMGLWILPIVIVNQWWDSLFFGRHSLITGIGIGVLASVYLENKKYLFFLTIIYVLIASTPAVLQLKKNIPYLALANYSKTLPQNGLYIETHFSRPQIDGVYKGEIVFVNEPGFEKKSLNKKINYYLANNFPVFTSSQALSEPYGLYSGPYLHTLSLSYRNDFVLKNTIQMFTLEEYKVISREDNLVMYKIVSNKPSQYPVVPFLRNSKRRIDYYDPFVQLWFFAKNKLNPWISIRI